MGIIHVQTPDPHETEQLTTLFIAVTCTVFCKTERQFPVTTVFSRKYFVVMRAVHGLEVVFNPFKFHRWIHALLVIRKVTTGDVKAFLGNMWRHHTLVSGSSFRFLCQPLQFFNNDRTVGHPQGKAWSYIVIKGENTQLFAEFSVVSFLGLFQHQDMIIQFFLVRKTYSINTGKLLVLLIPFPIGTGDRSKLDGLDQACMRDVRATAEIGKCTLGIKTDFSICETLQQIQFVFIPFFGKIGDGIILGNLLANENIILFGQLSHLFFKIGQFLFRYCFAAKIHVIIKAPVNGRPHPKFHSRKRSFNRLCKKVCGRMPKR